MRVLETWHVVATQRPLAYNWWAGGMDRLSDRRSDSEALVLDAGPRALLPGGRVLRYVIIILAVGMFIANSHHYFAHPNGLMAVVSALLAVLLWPLVLLGIGLHLKSSG